MDIADLKRLMRESGEKQTDVARLLGITPDKVSKSLGGTRLFSAREWQTLQDYFVGDRRDGASAIPRLPIVGLVSAGGWREGFEEVRGWLIKPDPSLSDDSFVVIVDGDSMNEVADDGVAIIVDPRERELIAGKLYVIRNGEGDTIFKKYQDNPARLVPCSSNDTHQPIYPGQEHFTIIGRAMKKVIDL